jgi:hypothetical protein
MVAPVALVAVAATVAGAVDAVAPALKINKSKGKSR